MYHTSPASSNLIVLLVICLLGDIHDLLTDNELYNTVVKIMI